MTICHLRETDADSAVRVIVETDGAHATLFRYPSGIAALRLANARGHVTILPWMGQMVWDGVFDGVRLTMGSLFDQPLPATDILGTYGCFAYHAGLLRNGVPGPQDDHALHGEFPVVAMDSAAIETGADGQGPYLRLIGSKTFRRGFGAHYRATPSVTLRAGRTDFDIGMAVRNLSAAPMDLMYMAHVNFADVPDGTIVQPMPFDTAHMTIRRSFPPHVHPAPEYLARLDALAADPSAGVTLGAALVSDPELVWALHGLARDRDGNTHVMLQRPEGDAFALSWNPDLLPEATRWLLRGPDVQVAGFALPATCGPEGYTAEHAAGRVRTLAPGAEAVFWVRVAYLEVRAAADMELAIRAL